ncbi:unnamed protein product [Rhizoctonia solani]|uniref:DUF6535 domain-containing protein n=1 Tax=Rhizoctonia solani TaxID=456999 RepID=A0A8H3DNL9_9AGAM|nr:unnamed protein product [Rhizoctonia solani]
MDLLLVFASLFSAISSAFVIESSGMLQQDPNDASAATLLVISQTLAAIANNNTGTVPPADQSNASDFVPARTAVIINVLWYLSLSLSIATAFIAMLAKDWSYSFAAHRTGHPRDQALRRQRKWKMIERWRMQELLVILPSLMHLSLLSYSPTSSDEDKSINALYTRGLEFLGMNYATDLTNGKHGTTGDLEVMVWDLKSQHESKTANLIKAGNFVPTEDNLEAMKLGNSASSQSLRFLTGGPNNGTESLYLITKLLSRHLESQDKQFHPAAVQSLANAAVLHTSLSETSGLPPNLAKLCMHFCEQVIREQAIREQSGNSGFQFTNEFWVGVVFIISVLLQGRASENQNQPADMPQHINQLRIRTRALHAIRTLIGLDAEVPAFGVHIFWVGCTEILSNRSAYGLSEGTGDWETLERWSSGCASNYVHEYGTPYIPSWNRDTKTIHFVRNKLLMAISQVYELVAVSRCYGSAATQLPESIYTFITRLEQPTDKDEETILSAIGTTYTKKAQPHGRRHFAATQLWLLLHLAGNTTSDDQRRLRENIERALEGSRQLRSKGFDQVKTNLEVFIIGNYRADHRVSKKVTENDSQPPYIWDKIKTSLLARRTGKDSQQPSLHLSSGFNLLHAGPEDHRSLGNHQRLYTARIIEQIVQTRGLEGNEDLLPLIECDLKELPACLGLSPELIPLPLSRAMSQSSAQIEDKPALRTTAEPQTIDAGHVSVEVHDSGPLRKFD